MTDEIWKYLKAYIPSAYYFQVARKLIRIFKAHDIEIGEELQRDATK